MKIKENGITLIALVITIVLLVILAEISIASLTGSGIFAQTQLAKEKNKYTSAKEEIIIKLMEISIEKQNVYTIVDIANNMKEADNITIEKYFNSEVASIKPGITEEITNLKAIAISVDEYSEYKFLIGKECKVSGVIKGKILDTTQETDFKEVAQFEKEQFNISVGSSSGTQTPVPDPEPEPPVDVTLASRVNVGDYEKYIPDTVTITDSEETTDEKYTQLLSYLSIYSGNTDKSYNTSSTITQETSLNWRVLDKITDEDGKVYVRLISETPTTSQVRLYGCNGYNNAVYLIDKMCNTLYNNSTYAKEVQNLKIEDIVKYMKIKPTLSDTTVSPSLKKYPIILEQEKNQILTIGEETTNGTLDVSEQNEPIDQPTPQTATSWNLKITYWDEIMSEDSFTDPKYNNLFIKNNEGSNYSTYFMSSRCVALISGSAYYLVNCVDDGQATATGFYFPIVGDYGRILAFRPVITLNADVMIDEENSGDGTNAENAYILK